MLGLSLIGMQLVGWSITLSPVGFTYHGMPQGKAAVSRMDNKVTKDGRWAYNPQFHLTAKTEHWQFGGGYVKDCFNNSAGMLYVGPKQNLGRYFSIGGVIGTYMRRSPDVGVFKVGPNLYGKVNKLPMSKTVGALEMAPLAAFTASVEVPVTKSLSIESNAAIAVFMNHFMIGIKYNFN